MLILFRMFFHVVCSMIIVPPLVSNATNNWQDIQTNFLFLTFWNQLLASIFVLLSIAYDFSLLLKINSLKWRALLSHFYNAVIFPLSIYMLISLWIITTIETMFSLTNFLLVTMPSIIILEKLIVYHPYFKMKSHLIGIFLMTVTYQIYVLYMGSRTGSYFYFFTDSFIMNTRLLLFLTMWPIITVVYVMGCKLNMVVWRKTLRTVM